MPKMPKIVECAFSTTDYIFNQQEHTFAPIINVVSLILGTLGIFQAISNCLQ
jgi:hypothetical protein